MTCEELAQLELDRLHDLQVLMQALVYIFGSKEFLDSLDLKVPVLLFKQ